MPDRRLLEDGSRRLTEEGGYRLLEQQSPEVVVPDATTIVSSGGARRKRPRPIRVESEFRPPIDVTARLVEDDDVFAAQIEVLPGRTKVRRRRAAAALLLH